MAVALLVALSGCRIIPEGHAPVSAPPVRYGQAYPGAPGSGQPNMGGPVEPTPPAPPTAMALGIGPGPDITTLGLTAANAGPALVSFRESCPRLAIRHDISGLTTPADWQSVCAAAGTWPLADAANLFTSWFDTAVVGSGATYVTGYYEPEIAGVRSRQPGYEVPVYGVPADLVRARPGEALPKSNGDMPFGRYDDAGHFVPYFDRGEIQAGVLNSRRIEIGWAADPVEFFFLQIQGSGRLRGPDGGIIRIGYAAENGRDYSSIGAGLRARGLIGPGPGQYPGSMQGIMQYLRDHPEEAPALMNQNRSWVFCREITGDGPIGAMGVPVRARVSLAADPNFVPLGAPVFLHLDPALAGATVANGLWVAQDTGGAIKGPNRFDSFWGTGVDARTTAGGMVGRGMALVLLPRGVVARQAALVQPQGYAPQGYQGQGSQGQGYQGQSYPARSYPAQTYPAQGYPAQTYPAQGYRPQSPAPQSPAPQPYTPQPYTPKPYVPQVYPSQGYVPQGNGAAR